MCREALGIQTDLRTTLGNRNLVQETDVGEVVVYNVKDKDIPIVHRIVRKFGTGYAAQDAARWRDIYHERDNR